MSSECCHNGSVSVSVFNGSVSIFIKGNWFYLLLLAFLEDKAQNGGCS